VRGECRASQAATTRFETALVITTSDAKEASEWNVELEEETRMEPRTIEIHED
jgi:hypothetical protein